MLMLLLTALAAETLLAEGLTLKLRFARKVVRVLVDLVRVRRLMVSETDEQLILPLKTLIRKTASKCLHLKWTVKKFNVTKSF
jgi:hypothetical protein